MATESSFKLEPQQHDQETRKTQENWQDIIRRDLKDIGLTWDEAGELAHSRSSWRQRLRSQVRFCLLRWTVLQYCTFRLQHRRWCSQSLSLNERTDGTKTVFRLVDSNLRQLLEIGLLQSIRPCRNCPRLQTVTTLLYCCVRHLYFPTIKSTRLLSTTR